MRLYRDSPQLAHRIVSNVSPDAIGIRGIPDIPPAVILPLGFSGAKTKHYVKMPPAEARQLAAALMAAAHDAEET